MICRFILLFVLNLLLLPVAAAANELWRAGVLHTQNTNIQPLIDVAQAGDTILIEEGFYYEKLFFNKTKGTEQDPITIQPKLGHRVTVSAAEEYLTIPNSDQWELSSALDSNRNDIYRSTTLISKTHRLVAHLLDDTRLFAYQYLGNFLLSAEDGPGQGVLWMQDTDSATGIGYLYIYLTNAVDPNTQPIFMANGSSSKDQPLRFWESEWISVRNIDFRHGGFSSIKLQRSHNITIDNNKILGGQFGIGVSAGSSNNTFSRNEIRDIYDSAWWWEDRKSKGISMESTAIHIGTGGSGNVIKYNRVTGFFNGFYIGTSIEENSYEPGTVHNLNTIIHNNAVTDIMDDAFEFDGFFGSGEVYENLLADVYVGMSLTARWGDDPLYIYRNRVHANKSVLFERDDVGTENHINPSVTKLGGGIDGNSINHPTENVNFYHNTLFGTHFVVRGGFANTTPTPEFPKLYPENYKWHNNIFYSVNGVLAEATGEASNGVEFDGNLYWQEIKGPSVVEYMFRYWDMPVAQSNVRYNSLSDVLTSISPTVWESSGLEVSPDFINSDPFAINDTLLPSSDAINKGIAINSSWPDSVALINGADIGAIETTQNLALNTITPNVAHPNGGISVIITGTGFDGTTEVSFGDNALENLLLVSSSTIFGTVPASTGSENIDVSVTNNGEVVTLPFTYSLTEWADSDNDGYSDAVDNDIDGDGLLNDEETAHGTNPLIADTDGDGFSDGVEINQYGSNPLVTTDTPANGDVTENGQTNTGDLVVCGRIALGNIENPTQQQIVRCDVAPFNALVGIPLPDGLINASDIMRLTRTVLQI